jgi:hypothetical protein
MGYALCVRALERKIRNTGKVMPRTLIVWCDEKGSDPVSALLVDAAQSFDATPNVAILSLWIFDTAPKDFF